MSLNVVPIQSLKVIPEKFNYKKNKVIPLIDAGENVLYQTFTANNTNNNSITVVANPPGKNHIVDNNIYQYFEVDFTIKATNSSGVSRKILENYGSGYQNICPRSYPLARVTETLNISMNSSNINTNVNNYLDGIIPYDTTKNQITYDWSSTPTKLDNVYDYSLGVTGALGGTFGEFSYPATTRDVFNGDLFDCEQVDSRGSFVGFEVVSNPTITAGASGTCVLKLKVVERAMISPFYYQSCGFAGLQTMSYLITLGDLSNMLSFRKHSPIASTDTLSLVPSSITAEVKALKLQMRYYTPKLLDSVPKITLYDYIEIQQFDNSASGTVTSGAEATMEMSAVNLNSIPSDVLVMLYENKNDRQLNLSSSPPSIYKPDVSNAFIQQINLLWNGRNGYISSASPEQLANIAWENGLRLSYTEISKFCGSHYKINIPKDLGLKSNECVSLLSNPQLGATVKFKNISNRTINFTLGIKVVYQGIVTIMDGMLTKQVGLVSQLEAIKSFEGKEHVEPALDSESKQLSGTGRIGGFNPLAIASLVKNIISGATKVADFINPLAKGAVKVAEAVGLGMAEEEEIQDLMNRKLKMSKLGSGRVGGKKAGKMISRDQLMDY